jgi:hypothetical protein
MRRHFHLAGEPCRQSIQVGIDGSALAGQFGIAAQVIGHVEAADRAEVVVDGPHGIFSYS